MRGFNRHFKSLPENSSKIYYSTGGQVISFSANWANIAASNDGIEVQNANQTITSITTDVALTVSVSAVGDATSRLKVYKNNNLINNLILSSQVYPVSIGTVYTNDTIKFGYLSTSAITETLTVTVTNVETNTVVDTFTLTLTGIA